MVRTRTPREIAPDLVDRLKARFRDYPLVQGWGLAIEEIAAERAVISISPSPAVANSAGVVNGGVLATLADIACALALSTHFDGRMPFATSDLHIRYLEPVDAPLRIEAAVVRASLRSAVMECRLKCGERVMALCTAHFTIKLPREAR